MSETLIEEVRWLRGRVEELEDIINDKEEMLDSLASELDKCNKTISMLETSEHNLFLERSSLIGTIDRLKQGELRTKYLEGKVESYEQRLKYYKDNSGEHNKSMLGSYIEHLEQENRRLTSELADAKWEIASYNSPDGQRMLELLSAGQAMTDCVIRLKNKFGIDRNIDDPKSIVKAAIEAHENLLRDISTRRNEGYCEGLNTGMKDCANFIKYMESTTLLDLYNNYHDSNLGAV